MRCLLWSHGHNVNLVGLSNQLDVHARDSRVKHPLRVSLGIFRDRDFGDSEHSRHKRIDSVKISAEDMKLKSELVPFESPAAFDCWESCHGNSASPTTKYL